MGRSRQPRKHGGPAEYIAGLPASKVRQPGKAAKPCHQASQASQPGKPSEPGKSGQASQPGKPGQRALARNAVERSWPSNFTSEKISLARTPSRGELQPCFWGGFLMAATHPRSELLGAGVSFSHQKYRFYEGCNSPPLRMSATGAGVSCSLGFWGNFDGCNSPPLPNLDGNADAKITSRSVLGVSW